MQPNSHEPDDLKAQLTQRQAELDLLKEERDAARRQLQVKQAEVDQLRARPQAAQSRDNLTGLFSSSAFRDKLGDEFQRAVRYKTPLSVAIIDLDEFKRFNDAFGSVSGDEALRTVARALQNTARNTDYVARLGGEEFGIILVHGGAVEAQAMAKRLRDTLPAFRWSRKPVTVSIGLATLAADMVDPSSLIQAAQFAVSWCKQNGRNRIAHAQDILPKAA